jgi:DnaJ domain
MKTCSCGNVAEENGAQCSRCDALQALELKTDCTSAEIHSAYEVLSKAWNPDRFQDDGAMKAMAEERFGKISAAYALLVRGSVQAAPFRSEAAGERNEAPIDAAPEAGTNKRARKSQRLGYNNGPKAGIRVPMPLVIGCGALVAAVITGWFLFEPLDARLMGIPVAGKVYADVKLDVRSRVQEWKNKTGIGTGSTAPPAASADATPTEDQPAQEAENSTPVTHRVAPQQPAHSHVLPFITAGLTKSEVIAAQGNPTAETGDEMEYGKSKLFFGNGVLIGWQIDPTSSLRVKLWPDAVVDPNLQSFGMGSTKNDVLVVQGTPTIYSQNTFGYGNSEVYFQNGRVTGWKNDNATPLRTTSR